MSELTWWLIAGAVWAVPWLTIGNAIGTARGSLANARAYPYVSERPAPALATRVETAPLPASAPVVHVHLEMPTVVPVPASRPLWIDKEIEG